MKKLPLPKVAWQKAVVIGLYLFVAILIFPLLAGYGLYLLTRHIKHADVRKSLVAIIGCTTALFCIAWGSLFIPAHSLPATLAPIAGEVVAHATTPPVTSEKPSTTPTHTPTPATPKPTIVAATPTPTPVPSSTATLTSDNSYVNVDGNTVPDPTYSSEVPTGATAQCRDGSYSFSQNHSGTCSHHGGVAQWL